jgi:predicted membrane channel-forming protein YqfA (hemolysin III family)
MLDISRQYLYLKNRRIVVLLSTSFEMMKSGSAQQSTSYLKWKLTDHKKIFVLIVLTRGIMLHNK